MPTVGEIKLDFFVFSLYDPKVLLISDNSNWLHIESKPAVIDITIPGSSKSVRYTFLKNGINSFNSHNLGITCLGGGCTEEEYSELPDGIYTITLTGSPDSFTVTKYHLKTDRVKQRIDKILITLGLEFDTANKEIRDEVLDIQTLLQIAEAFIRQSNIDQSKTFFDAAYDRLTDLEKRLEE